jgi:hypothetical protein
VYNKLKQEASSDYKDLFEEEQVLEEEALYRDLSVNWMNILLQIPNLINVEQDRELDNYRPHYPVNWKWESYVDITVRNEGSR